MRERIGTITRGGVAAVGRRKTAVARVLLQPGSGTITINGLPLEQRVPREALRSLITLPLRLTNTATSFNVLVKAAGGGISGQAGAIAHGIARALVKADETYRPILRKAGLVTRDPRVKERKKYGLRKARKAPQYSKR